MNTYKNSGFGFNLLAIWFSVISYLTGYLWVDLGS